jgi:hypothetical protein
MKIRKRKVLINSAKEKIEHRRIKKDNIVQNIKNRLYKFNETDLC